MLKKAMRVAVVLLTAGSTALASVVPPTVTSAATPGTLFAITRLQQLLVKVDPTTGSLTQVTSLLPNCSSNCPVDSQSFDLASDPTTHRLFAERFEALSFNFPPVFEEELLTIDSQTGAILSNPQFTSRPPGELAFDTSSHTLFGFTGNEIVKVDPATATVTPFASVGSLFGVFNEDMAVSPTTHTIFISVETGIFPAPPSPGQIFAVDSMTGQVSPGVPIDQPVRSVATDGATLLGITDPQPQFGQPEPVRIDPTTGMTTLIGGLPTTPGGFIPNRPTVDPSTHTLFVDISISSGGPFQDNIFSVNDRSGISSSAPILSGDNLTSIVFEAPPQVTPESIKADVRAALASGAIDNAGVANSLLAKLDAAAVARATAGASGARTNACATAAHIYQAFIAEVTALSAAPASGVRPHIDSAAAAQLISEAQFLIANCP